MSFVRKATTPEVQDWAATGKVHLRVRVGSPHDLLRGSSVLWVYDSNCRTSDLNKVSNPEERFSSAFLRLLARFEVMNIVTEIREKRQ